MPDSIFAGSPYPIRPDLEEATREAWAVLEKPGTWWSGAERMSLVSEVRAARECKLCAERAEH